MDIDKFLQQELQKDKEAFAQKISINITPEEVQQESLDVSLLIKGYYQQNTKIEELVL